MVAGHGSRPLICLRQAGTFSCISCSSSLKKKAPQAQKDGDHPAAGMQGVTRRKGGQVGFADPCARVSLISPRRRRDGWLRSRLPGASPAAAVAGHSSAPMRAEVSPMPPRAAARPAGHSGELVFGGCRSNFKSARPCGGSSAGVAGARHGARPAPGLLRAGPIWVSAMLAADGLILSTFHKPDRRNVSHSRRLPLPCVPPCAASCCTSPPISPP